MQISRVARGSLARGRRLHSSNRLEARLAVQIDFITASLLLWWCFNFAVESDVARAVVVYDRAEGGSVCR